jgi:hypothetical protein
MKKITTLFLFFMLFVIKVSGQVCHIEIRDNSGFNTQPYEAILENEACQLRNAFPAEFQNQFKVVEAGFYLLSPQTTLGVPPVFDYVKTQAATTSEYYFLICKQTDPNGIYTKFWVDIKLPETGVFLCLNESKLALIKEAIVLEIEEKYTLLGRNPYQYADAEIAGLNYLKSIINSIKSGNCCPILPETIKNILLAKGYKTMPVNLIDKPPARPGENINRFPASVEDNANMLIEILEQPGFIDMAIALGSDVSFATVDGISAKAIITKNSNFCDAQIFQRVQNGFSSEGLQAFIHCHYWENPDTVQPDLLIAKTEYIPTIPLQEVEITGETGDCGAVQLPTEPLFYNYAVTMDNGVYYGYNWGGSSGGYNWGGQWNKSDIVEYQEPNTYNLPSEIAEAEHTWADGGVEYNPFIAPYFRPSWRAYFLQKVEWTSDLEYKFHYWASQPGLRLTTEREITFQQFKHPDIVPPNNNIGSSLAWKCDSKVSRQIHSAPTMNTELVKLESILKSWLISHNNLDDLFTENRALFDNVINSPNLSSLLIPSQLALFGGTQGLKIQVRSLRLLPTNCPNGTSTTKHFYCEVFFTVYDNFGAGISDAKRWHPGLVDMWVLQHHRNAECDSPPCYIPITDHSAQIFHSFEICIGN